MAETTGVAARSRNFAEEFLLREQVLLLLHQACVLLDERRYRDWIELFAPDGRYIAISAENFENNWPLAVIDDDHKSMLDRVEMIENYWSVEPFRTRRMVGDVDIGTVSADRLSVRSAFVVYLINSDGQVEIQAVGTYRDELVYLDRWRIRRRTAVHDNELLTHTVTYPF